MGEILRYKMYTMYLLLGLALVQYQNCAGSNEAFDESSPAMSAGDSTVDGIDQVNVGDISFAQNKVQAYINDEVIVSGVCGQTGSLIGWTLKDPQGEVIERGLSECNLGSFHVALGSQWEGFCDQDLELKARLGAQASSEAIIESYCE